MVQTGVNVCERKVRNRLNEMGFTERKPALTRIMVKWLKASFVNQLLLSLIRMRFSITRSKVLDFRIPNLASW